MQKLAEVLERRTTADLVYEKLYEQIVSLDLLPGTKLSESEIASRFGVSRQPVRDAFSKLESQNLLLIRPQKATQVRGFSLERIAHSRFVRLAVELEVVRAACSVWDKQKSKALDENLQQQKEIVSSGDTETFHALDYAFHKMICELGGHRMALETIQTCKKDIDRLCVLSLGRSSEAQTLFEDHTELAAALKDNAPDQATQITRRHLARLDDTIHEIHQSHQAFFEDAHDAD